MKSILVTSLAISIVSISAYAKNIDLACVGKAVSKVNSSHIAKGGAYAVKILHDANAAATVLIGYSDDEDPIDYVVVVDKISDCKIVSVTVADDEGDVSQYSNADTAFLDQANAAYGKVLVSKGLELMKKIPTSGYDNKILCIRGDKVTARVPLTHWSRNDRKTMLGTLSNFPSKIMEGQASIVIPKSQKGILVDGTEHNGTYQVTGYVLEQQAEVCLMELKPVLK